MAQMRHMVLLKFKPTTPREEIGDIFEAIDELQEKIPGIEEIVSGVLQSPEDLSRGFTHGFVMTFADYECLVHYKDHPEHVKVAERIIANLEGGLDGVIVFDFEESDRFRYNNY